MRRREAQTPRVTAARMRDRFLHYLRYARGLELRQATAVDHLAALELVVRETLIDRAVATTARSEEALPKTVYMLCMEYLLGRLLRNNLIATNLLRTAHEAMQLLGLNLDTIVDEEPDPGLGNGGLGRLAACYLDSLATLDYPAFGYGLRYDYGMFHQQFENGWQVERPDSWLKGGYGWELPRPDLTTPVRVGGRLDWRTSERGELAPEWVDHRTIYGVPHDFLVAGHGTQTVAILRLWGAEAAAEFDLHIFSQGDFLRAVAEREKVDAITRVLYPADNVEAGRELRLQQEYFLVACSVHDVVRRFRERHGEAWELFPYRVALQINDTHPALTVAELMRFFVDEAELRWDKAWELTTATCGYTNHTLLPEALESWPVALVDSLVPRHMQIIREINTTFLKSVVELSSPEPARLERMAVIQENGEQRVRMANLAIIGSHRVNGVARLHTELLRRRVVKDFADLWPERFVAITNGITPRRWLLVCNPRLARAVSRRIGNGWIRDLDRLADLVSYADDPELKAEVLAIKRANKLDLAHLVATQCSVQLDPDSLFDVHVKRLHEYKRQLLNVMHIVALYLRLKADPKLAMVPRSFIFGAKAAPAYHMAKLIIKLVNSVADVVNRDPDVAGRIRVVFLPDYRVTLAETIIPAADLSEQISTAGMEASGTGNMKLALNGALTIGTLDGANIEIRDAVGDDNIFIFGHTAEEVEALRSSGQYDPRAISAADPELAAVVDALGSGRFVGGDANLLREIWSSLMERGDRYLHLADFRPYVDTQQRVSALYLDRDRWAAATIRNIAAMGYFSSDRAVREYAELVWSLKPLTAADEEAPRVAADDTATQWEPAEPAYADPQAERAEAAEDIERPS